MVRQLRRAYGAAGTTVNVSGAPSIYPSAILEFDNGRLKERRVVDSVSGNTVTFVGGAMTGAYWEGETVRVIEAEVRTRYVPAGVVQASRDLHRPAPARRRQPQLPGDRRQHAVAAR